MIFLIIGRYDGETNVIEKGVWHHARLLRQASRRSLRNTLIIIYTAFSLDRPSCLLPQ